MKKDFSKRILLGFTGISDKDWQDKLHEVDKYKLTEIALFNEYFTKLQRKNIYQGLLKTKVRSIPLVHARNDMTREEFVFLVKEFGAKYFTIHENSFKYLHKWKGFAKQLYLEMNYDNHLRATVDVGKIGGFCIDLAHFKVSQERWSKEFEYVLHYKKNSKYFKCNHLSGYSDKKRGDIHTVKSLKEFDYLKTLPSFIFSDYIAIEVFNSLKDQIKFKKYLIKFLNDL